MPDRERVHELLLALGGRIPDDGLALLRTLLADHEENTLADMLGDAIESGLLPLTADEAAIAAELTERHVESALDATPDPGCRFAPEVAHGDGVAEQVARDAAASYEDCRAVWRTWRTGPGPTVRVFLVEAAAGADLPELTAELQQWLAEVGEEPPRIEVFDPASALTPYHEQALAKAALIWTRDPAIEVRLARAFDGATPDGGPYFRPDRPRLDDPERMSLLAYLTEAEPIMRTNGTMTDIVEPARGAVVPMTFRSDGSWVWPETVAYYLAEHYLEPDPELVAHIRAAGGTPRALGRLERQRVLSALTAPMPDPVTWSVG